MISVVIPTHDRADLVAEAVASVLHQSYDVLEVIVVDDASSDDTVARLKNLPKVRVVVNETNVGPACSRNRGARFANGSILAFLDSDDLWDVDKLSRQFPLAASGVPSVTGIRFQDETDTNISTYIPPSDANERVRITNGFRGSGSTLVLPKDVFWAVGGFPEERRGTAEDWLLCALLVAHGHRIEVIEEVLATVRTSASAFTNDATAISTAMWSSVEWMADRGLVHERDPLAGRVYACRVIARTYANRGDWTQARRWITRLARYRPRAVPRALAIASLSAVRGSLRRAASK